MLLGVLALATAWLLRPRIPRLEEAIVPREQLPSLYSLVGRIAGRLGARPIDGIVVIPAFNAAFGRYGFRERRILFIGLPLFLTCEPDERAALLGHELAHSVNGDANRGIFVGTALHSLQTWHHLLNPGSIAGEEAARPDVSHPPTPYRIAFLRSRPVLEPGVVLSAAESERIDQELSAFHAAMRRLILNAHRRSLEVVYY